MKKTLLFSLFICFQSYGQSLLLTPGTIRKENSSDDDIIIRSIDTYPTQIWSRANGTISAPTALLSGNIITNLAASGHNGSDFTFPRANIRFWATQNWTSIANGTSITFGTTSNNSTTITQRMIINHDGKVGIGLTSPDQLLDVNGRMRIRHNGTTSGIWMSNSTNGLTNADGAFYGMLNDTQTGIWIGNNWRWWVTNTGNMNVTGEVNRSQTTDANMVPIAYGNVNGDGTINISASTNNFTAAKGVLGGYTIYLTGESYSNTNYTTVASLVDKVGFVEITSFGTDLVIYTYDKLGNPMDSKFNFVIYKK
ncbi:MAG: hypothetical protein ACRCVT_14720 [Leadbetterella sp.]